MQATDETFDELVVSSNRLVAVDVWAPWCPHCPAVATILTQLAAEFDHGLRVVKLNYDENPRFGQAYRIMSLPTVLFFAGGEPVHTIIGVRPASHFRSAILAHLG